MPSTAQQDDWLRTVIGVNLPPAAPPPPSTGLGHLLGDLVDKVVTTVRGPDPASPEKSRLLARLATLKDPPGLGKTEAAATAKQRQAAEAALKPDAPDAAALATAAKAIDALDGLIAIAKRTKAVADLTAADPDAGQKATAAFTKFAGTIGTKPVNPDTIKQATADKGGKQTTLDNTQLALTAAQKLPDGKAKTAAIAKATKDYNAAKSAFDQADALEDAMLGQTSLTAALSTGPLSPGSHGPLKDKAISAKLIDAYNKSGRMADAAVTAAAGAKFPGLIADNVGPMIDRAKGGFADKNGVKSNSTSFSEKYGSDLLGTTGQLGPDYAAGLPDYLASGQQFVRDASGDGTAATWNGLAQNRSNKLAGAMIKPDGSIDATSDAAKAAMGNALYHPNVMQNPTPGLGENVLRTMNVLKDPATGPKASTVLKGVTAPTNPAGQALVRGATGGAATTPVDDTGARTAVLSAMFQPLDQAKVGSCFVTGPARRLRESDPVKVMESYAELASKGTFTPANGKPALPAITNLPPDENPLIRSYEYTAATAGARNADSIEHQTLNYDTWQGTTLLKDVATKGSTDKNKDWAIKQGKLAQDIGTGFTFTYDPTSEIKKSADGSSSMGRYIVVHNGKEIRTKPDFQAAMLEVALASLGVTATSDEGKEVARIVNSDAFAAKVCPRDGQAPWEMAGGGYAEGTIESLYGTKVNRTDMIGAASTGLGAPSEGARTKQVLSAMLKSFRGSPATMATVDTSGQHSFNALPNDPSLAAIQGKDDAETDRKIQANLVDKGTAMKNTAIPPERAAALFDDAIKREAGSLSDPALQKAVDDGARKWRPDAAMTPADLARAIDHALAPFHDKSADAQTASWKSGELTAGRAVTPELEAKHKAELKAAWDVAAQNAAKGAMMKDLGAPEFKIADTNWGDATNHTYFVIAPDPVSGEPLLWMKTEPPGSLAPAGRDWIDRPWQTFR